MSRRASVGPSLPRVIRISRVYLALMLALAITSQSHPAQAQPDPGQSSDSSPDDRQSAVLLDYEPPLPGRQDRWVEVRLRVSNTGEDRQVEVVADGQGNNPDVIVPLDLPSQSDKIIPIRLPATGAQTRIEIRDGRDVLAKTVVKLNVTNEPIVVVVQNGWVDEELLDLDGFAPPGGAGVTAASTVPGALPSEPLALGSVSALVLANGDLVGVEVDQLEAIRKWVALGGLLVVNGGPTAASRYAGLPDSIRPATVTGVTSVADLDGLADIRTASGSVFQGSRSSASLPEGGASLAVLRPADGARVAASADDNTPLVVARPYGYGSVIGLAFDVMADNFANWGRLDQLWRAVSIEGGNSLWTSGPRPMQSLGNFLVMTERDALPRTSTLALFMAGFVIVLGPANYVWLRRRRALELAWLTIPALTVVASLTAYGAGVALHGRSLRVHRVSAVEVIGDTGVAYASSLVGIFSPAARSYDVEIGAGLVRSQGLEQGGDSMASDFAVTQNGVAGIRDLKTAQWAFTTFTTEAVLDWPATRQPTAGDDAAAAAFWEDPLGSPQAHDLRVAGRGRSVDLDSHAPGTSEGLAQLLVQEGESARSGAGGDPGPTVSVPGTYAEERLPILLALAVAATEKWPSDSDAPWRDSPWTRGAPPPRSMQVTTHSAIPLVMGWLDAAPYPIRVGDKTSGPDDVTFIVRRLGSSALSASADVDN